jgi:hypothetical protein
MNSEGALCSSQQLNSDSALPGFVHVFNPTLQVADPDWFLVHDD